MRSTCNIFVERNGAEEECGKPSVYSEPCCFGCGAQPGATSDGPLLRGALRRAGVPA